MSQNLKRKSQWNRELASKMNEVELLVYRSNILGNDQSITNTGGGNTSAKVKEKDPITKETVEVLWVKGSGGDLRTSKKENFSSLYNNKILSLKGWYADQAVKGIKTKAEDDMVGLYNHCTFNLNPRATSIDTPLHALIPKAHIDHMHATAVIAIAACDKQEELTQTIWGGAMGYVPWMRPGWELALELERVYRSSPEIKGVLMGQHGFISWGDTSEDCYLNTLDLINKAEAYLETHDLKENTFGGQKYSDLKIEDKDTLLGDILPFVRGKISKDKKLVGTVQYDDFTMKFVNSFDAKRLSSLGTSCPDHFLRTKIQPLYVDWDPTSLDLPLLKKKIEEGLVAYQKAYQNYYDQNKEPASPAIRNSSPSVILIPGLGLIGWGKNKSESRVTAEFFGTAIEVMKGADSVGHYQGLPAKEAFDIEYWALEEAKLKRMPPENEFGRAIAVVIGAGNGIGKEVANILSKESAHIVCADISLEQAQKTASTLEEKYGKGIGVAGSGISDCGAFIGLAVDISCEKSLSKFFNDIVLAYGGIDHLVVTAGVFIPSGDDGKVTSGQWDKTFEINVKGAYQSVMAAKKVFDAQDLPGTVVLTTSVNAVVSKIGSIAYDTSKAAANHLVRELAIEMAPNVRVNGLAPATVIQGSTMFSKERVISSLRKYKMSAEESEPIEVLTERLARFYADRTLLKKPITPVDQAQIVKTLCSASFHQSTGQIIAVDGGLKDAFLR